MKLRLFFLAAFFALAFAFIDSGAQDKKQPKKEVIPHAQDKPPGPPLSPQEALKKMQVPPGFHVELVAAEPDIVNPVAMTFDERGRIWITESLEYPRRSAGPGKDRVKVLESTKGDGKFDKITTVIEGLNIPSGIAIGHGGVWVANAPDILFYPFEDFANAKLGKPQVVVTGFGRFDTHELPNSLTWGPDGWLYGLNGVFNRSVVKQDGKTFDFTCALFKIHPKTKKFELFCEGTSNPWGLAFNENGDAFISACVIDHLWHLTETGYYHRQGGPYPPYTWKIGSIVKHKHQKAAYCGLCWFDSDAYPPEYREKMYMGNIHGNAINCDMLEKDGSTYSAKPALTSKSPGTGVPGKGVGEGSNFLLANDAWFMPVVQKVGPDGCMYILDWYDRYHCYQDANRDPAGIDRDKGRLYRVVYGDYKPAGKVDLTAESEDDAKVVARLKSANVYYRETIQRLVDDRLGGLHVHTKPPERGLVERKRALALYKKIQEIVNDQREPLKIRLQSLLSISNHSYPTDSTELLRDADSTIRAWAVRTKLHPSGLEKIPGGRVLPDFIPGLGTTKKDLIDLAKDKSPDVQLQVAIAARKAGVDPLPILLDVLTHCGDDKLIPHIVWQNLHPLLEKDGDRFLTMVSKVDLAKSPGVAKVLPRAIDRILGNASGDPAAVVKFIDKLSTGDPNSSTANLCVTALTARVQNKEIAGKQLEQLKKNLAPLLDRLLDDEKRVPLRGPASLLSVSLGFEKGTKLVKLTFEHSSNPSERLLALDALITGRYKELRRSVEEVIDANEHADKNFRGTVIGKLANVTDPWVAESVLKYYPRLTGDEQAKSIELLTQRPTWAKSLFSEIAAKKMSKDVVNVNQARRLLAMKDTDLKKLIEKHWGLPRDARNPEREKLVAQMKELYKKMPGDPKAGVPVFKKLCAQCHKIYGEGVDVGPDITSNGRADFDQLLSNIFDPSLVIGAGYQTTIINTKQGQSISGLLVEDNAQRVVMKVQGGELKTIARADIDEQITSKLSMMPEDLEKQLRPQEIIDLLSYLSLDRPPEDAKAKRIPGTPR